jgi:HEPN domain-containing protein
MHCVLSELLKRMVKRFPAKPCEEITHELASLLAEYIASTAPAGECESAIKIICEDVQKLTRDAREEFRVAGLIKEATVQ